MTLSPAQKHLIDKMDLEDTEVTYSQVGFKRKKSGHIVEPGWSARQKGINLTTKPNTPMTLRWLPLHRGQGIKDQIRHCNVYYVVDGLVNDKQVFHTSLHGFLSPKSAAMVEYTRLMDIAKTMEEIVAGEAARMRITRLLAAAPT